MRRISYTPNRLFEKSSPVNCTGSTTASTILTILVCNILGTSQTNLFDDRIGIRNSHDQSLAVGLAAGISVMCCSNLAFGGAMVLQRRHTRRIELGDLVVEAVEELEMEFLNLETVSEDLKLHEVSADEARAVIVRAAEVNAINSCDIVPIFREFRNPCHEEFAEPTRWSLLNAFTEHSKKYSPGRADICHRGLTRLFGLDGNRPELWPR